MRKSIFTVFTGVIAVGVSLVATDVLAVTSCSAGKYLSGSSCKTCLDGQISAGGKVTSCTTCAAGTYEKNHKSCEVCPAGSYCVNGVKKACPAGSYCPSGAGSPKACTGNT